MEALSTTQAAVITATVDDQTSRDRDPEDVILLTVIRCIGLLYGYYQIRLLCNLGSKFTLAVTSIFPLFGSLIFNSFNYLLPEEFNEIPETLLYFLLILDLPRACFLTSIALQRSECCKIGACSSSILQGVKILAPWLTMDTVIECIVLILGYCSGIRRLEALCTFVCLSVLINYSVLLAVFPLALRIIHEVVSTNKETCIVEPRNEGNNLPSTPPVKQIRRVSFSPEPSLVKSPRVISSGGSRPPAPPPKRDINFKSTSSSSSYSKLDQLVYNWETMSKTPNGSIHNHEKQKKFFNVMYGTQANLPAEVCLIIQPSGFWLRGKILAAVFLALAYVFGWISISVDQLVVLSVAAALTIRYLFFEEKNEGFRKISEESTVTTTTTTVNTIYIDSGANSATPTLPATQAPQGMITSCNGSTLGNTDSSTSAPIPIAPIISTTRTRNTSTTTPTPSQRVRKMPVNAKEVEILLAQNGLNSGKKHGDFRDMCSSPDSGISKSSSGSVTPITFSIGDHSESDDEGDSEDQSAADLAKIEKSAAMLEKLKMEREQKEKELEGDSDRWSGPPRPLEECLSIYKTDDGVKQLSDEEIINLVDAKYIPAYQLEKAVQDLERGVAIRRKISCMQKDIKGPTPDIPYKHYDYTLVQGACCENVIGYIPVPVGIAGPLKMDGQSYYIPMATTEGCLVASTNRGCRAMMQTGVRSRVVNDGMSRAPVVRFPSATRAAECMIWLGETENFQEIKQAFDSSSRFARLSKIHPRIAGRYLFIRFVAKTGDAMGMNMISKGTEVALSALTNHFPDIEVLALSGNVCTDKKPAAINWLEGRGKSVVAEAIIPANVVETVLKTTTADLVELNIAKNLIGSATAGSIGGFNAHAANIVTAVYIACGQDPAQNVASSNCITIMEPSGADGRDLFISCTMPSVECGTIGGGTILPAQAACLEMLGVKGANAANPGENARTFARIVSAAVLAGELSLMSALAAGHLVKSHLKHNRSATLLTAIAVEQNKGHTEINNTCTPFTPSPEIQSLKIHSQTSSSETPHVFNNQSINQLNSLTSSSDPIAQLKNEELIKNSLNSSKSSPVITTMDFLSVPDCKQT